ncbi:hypothetical protein PSTG_02440 [Puccinia striiformis f. sp. tritici PST-78]|uniref:Uncharacterized protein n=1 Tax=Puccinia striiformis f. sp. tritici PST-78 TaxID=1165861 RepID=A0A0L0VZV3_9BASI|nr:hypothetical protein PSTG_02440 [Puccinia striiformis f. sp. tritici PST-78]
MDKREELKENELNDDDDYKNEEEEEIPVKKPKLKITLMPNQKPPKKVKKALINIKAAPKTDNNDEDDGYEDIEDEEPQHQPTLKQKNNKPKQDSKTCTNTKEWGLPNLNQNFETFIDHGTIVDDQGYPIYPNGRTVFVCLPNDNISNFGSVSYTKMTAINSRTNNTWKVSRPKCLGALVCDNPSCQWAGSPPTGKDGMDKFLSRYVRCNVLVLQRNVTEQFHIFNAKGQLVESTTTRPRNGGS